jgi:hypothetical protein
MNRPFNMQRLIAAPLLIFALSACTGTLVKPNGFQGEYDEPILVVKQAGINAMAIHGFVITQDTDTYIEGHRPISWSGRSFCRRGGERAAIWLEQTGPSHTRVAVHSVKGYACQEELTVPIILEIRKQVISLSINPHTW